MTINVEKFKSFASSPTWRRRRRIRAHYTIINSNSIFGMVGRCGGGYNTVWTDWSEQGRQDRELIMAEFEVEIDKLVGHYTNLEKSILKDGFLNPLIITCGYPLIRKIENVPPEWQDKDVRDLLLLEGGTGGSRLWIAQKYNMEIPCIINDTTSRFTYLPMIYSTDDVKQYYTTPPEITLSTTWGFREINDTATHIHLDAKYKSDKALVEERAIIYYNIMKKHGRTIKLPASLLYLMEKLDDQ